jgi:hypothetical protein
MRYVFTNTTSSVIENFHAGQYWDFDLDDTSYDDDIVSYNDSNKFAYVKDNDGNPTETHIGLTIFSENDFSLFAMDNDGSSNPTISWDGFTDNEKWIALTSKLEYSTSGPSDISLVISDGPFSIEQDSSISINFGIIAGENFEQLQSNIIRAREKFSTINFSEFSFNDTTSQIFALELKNNYPNPFNSFTTIGYDVPSMSNSLSTSSQTVLLDVYNILGEKVTTLVNEKQEPGEHIVNFNGGNLTSGVYLYRIQINGTFRTKKMLLLK